MSRRSFDYAHPHYGPLHVVAGWDRPLQRFFITLEQYRLSTEDDPIFLFDNLDSSTWPLSSPYRENLLLHDVRTLLEHFAIPLPVNFVLDLLEDAQRDVGSLDQHYPLRASDPRHGKRAS